MNAAKKAGNEPPKLSRTLTVAYKFIIDTIDRSERRIAAFDQEAEEVKKPSKKGLRPTRSSKKATKANPAPKEAENFRGLEEICQESALAAEESEGSRPTDSNNTADSKFINATKGDKANETKQSSPTKPEFTPPTLDEVKELFKKRAYGANPEEFFNFYESNGWHVGQNPMRNWEASAANWEIKSVRDRIDNSGGASGRREENKEPEKIRYGNFDIHEAFKRAVERSYNGYYDDDDEEDEEN